MNFNLKLLIIGISAFSVVFLTMHLFNHRPAEEEKKTASNNIQHAPQKATLILASGVSYELEDIPKSKEVEIAPGIKAIKREDGIVQLLPMPTFFPYVLRFFYHNAYEIFDMDKGFEWKNTELHEIQPQLSRKGGSRAADLLVKVHLKNGSTELFLLHLEIQKATNKNFSKRVFEYWYRLTDRYKSTVVSLAVFTGLKTQLQPDHYHVNLLGTELFPVFYGSTYPFDRQ